QCFISGGEKIEIVKNNTRTVFLENKSAPSQGLRSVGFIGKVFYQGELTPYLPVLKMGEYLHLGEGSHLGQGALRLHFSGIYFEPRQ
ncbi:MAG: CRISPR system precrRNA processing endoribonuclease RAMP protein Cas6, partial [Firmicutes bacterium]|nr:CRISPR system precrRNA processing endoribonuclease RAMP protein Cas6 [Bacillota bacterium]